MVVRCVVVKVRIESLVEGARRARGMVVVVDVFRAFTTAAVALSQGADKIILVADPTAALRLRSEGVGDLCMGEIGGKRPAGFDFGNSPFEISQTDLAGRTLIQSTRAGTVGICSVPGDPIMYAASLVVARATVEAIRRTAPALVTIVAMGVAGRVRADEDEQCAMYMRNLLEGRVPDAGAVRRLVAAGGEAAKFDDPTQPHFHPMDRTMALGIDAMDFAIRVTREDDMHIARRS